MLILIFAGFGTFTWSGPFNLSNNPGHSNMEPAITLDSTGRLHQRWYAYTVKEMDGVSLIQ